MFQGPVRNISKSLLRNVTIRPPQLVASCNALVVSCRERQTFECYGNSAGDPVPSQTPALLISHHNYSLRSKLEKFRNIDGLLFVRLVAASLRYADYLISFVHYRAAADAARQHRVNFD